MSGYKDILRYVCSSHITNMNFMTMGSLHPDLQDLFPEEVPGFLDSSRAGNVTGSRPVRMAGPIRCIVSPKLRRNVLLPNGDVVLCCHDYGMDHVLGNLHAGYYEDLFTSPQYRKVLTRQNDESGGDILCRYCDWSGSRMRAKCIFLREYVKEAIQPVKKKVKRILKGGAGNPTRRSTL
jgi:radical SAM protein with 4Fe4S-binding SPASM domain